MYYIMISKELEDFYAVRKARENVFGIYRENFHFLDPIDSARWGWLNHLLIARRRFDIRPTNRSRVTPSVRITGKISQTVIKKKVGS